MATGDFDQDEDVDLALINIHDARILLNGVKPEISNHSRQGDSLVFDLFGVLEVSDTVGGPISVVSDDATPQVEPIAAEQRFFRAR